MEESPDRDRPQKGGVPTLISYDRPDFALRALRFPCTLEKWYIDVLLDDGTVVLVYLGRLALLGVEWARVTTELFFADGRIIRASAPVATIRGQGEQLQFGDSRIEGERLDITAGELRGRLHYHARVGPLRLREPFITVGSRKLEWNVEVPDADVDGRLTWPGGDLAVRGRGYRDRVFFDLHPWSFPIRRLIWGRAVAASHAAFWLRAQIGAAGDDNSIHHAWLDGEVVTSTDGPVPAAVELGTSRTLLDAHVADLDGLHLGSVRGLLRRLTGDPHEEKRAAPCAILGAPGRAIHEVVTWRGGRPK
jgi:hypothetical protein